MFALLTQRYFFKGLSEVVHIILLGLSIIYLLVFITSFLFSFVFLYFLCEKVHRHLRSDSRKRIAAVVGRCSSCGAFGGAVWTFVQRSFKDAARATNCVGLLDDSAAQADPDPDHDADADVCLKGQTEFWALCRRSFPFECQENRLCCCC